MNEFDEICAVKRIVELYHDRLVEVTPSQVRKDAKEISNKYHIGVNDAYETIEDQLLAKPPKHKRERWD